MDNINTKTIVKNFISAVKNLLTADKWSVFDINFTGAGVPHSGESVRVHVKLDGNGGYLFGTNGCCDTPDKVVSETEFGELLKKYYIDNNIFGDWDFEFTVVSELHYYGIEVLPSYLDKDAYVRECRFRDKMFAEYGCD